MSNAIENIPWVEKYRPTKFDDIVLDETNRTIFNNILSSSYFPNLMFYGPPGTGKTTTIINLINEYNIKYNPNSKGIESNIITNSVWIQLKEILNDINQDDIQKYIHDISIKYNIDKKTIIKQYYNYIVRNHPELLTVKYLRAIEVIMHIDDTNCENSINYMKHI
jgi:replication-associated recombination protein RarA